MTDCIFCKIAKGQIPSKIAYETRTSSLFTTRTPRPRCMCW